MLDTDNFRLKTARLLIRTFTPDDIPAAFLLMAEAFGMETEAQARDWVLNTQARFRLQHALMQPPYGDFALIDASGALVGAAGYVPSYGPFHLLPHFQHLEANPQAAARFTTEWGLFWTLRANARGQGYATEAACALIDYAFEHFSLRRVVATTEADNAASIAVMRRLGMTVERNPRAAPAWFQVVGILEHPQPGGARQP